MHSASLRMLQRFFDLVHDDASTSLEESCLLDAGCIRRASQRIFTPSPKQRELVWTSIVAHDCDCDCSYSEPFFKNGSFGQCDPASSSRRRSAARDREAIRFLQEILRLPKGELSVCQGKLLTLRSTRIDVKEHCLSFHDSVSSRRV
jgi:hypothetical protein